jgi:phospholipase C
MIPPWSRQHSFRSGSRRCARTSRQPALRLETLEARTLPAAVPLPSLAYNDVSSSATAATAFVNELYHDVLFRAPSSAEQSALVGSLTSGKSSQAAAFSSLISSNDYFYLVNPAATLYQVYLGRPADSQGLSVAVNALRQGQTLGQVASTLVGSAEGQASYMKQTAQPGVSQPPTNLLQVPNDAFVNFLYQHVLARTSSAQELSSLVTQLANGAPRSALLQSFVQSPEFASLNPQMGNTNLVTVAYLGIWNRSPDVSAGTFATGLANHTIADPTALGQTFFSDAHSIGVGATRNYLIGLAQGVLGHDLDSTTYFNLRTGLLQGSMTDKDVLASLLGSADYQNNVLPVEECYQVFLGRTAENYGLAYWTSLARSGVSQATIVQGIAGSTEFKADNGDWLTQPTDVFANAMYQKVLKRAPQPAEVSYWAGQLNSGAETRGSAMFEAVRTPAASQANGDLDNSNAVILASRALLGHDPDSNTTSTLVSALHSGSLTLSGLMGNLMRSSEFLGNSYSQNVGHVIILYQENWSFDGLYGSFPGANGTQNLQGKPLTQLDRLGNPITQLTNATKNFNTSNLDPQFPGSMPVQLYNAGQFVQPSGKTQDIVHRFYQEQYQIDGGKNDRFVGWSDNGYLTLSQFDATNLPEGQLAQQYAIDDNFFHSAFGGSYLNHQFLIAAAPQPYPNAPASIVAKIDSTTGQLALKPDQTIVQDGKVTPDGYAVNTIYSPNMVPNFVTPGDANSIVPLTNDSNPNDPTRPYQQNIGDLLSQANVSWKWYSGGWNAAVALQQAYRSGDAAQIAAAKAPFNDTKNPLWLFQWHHQPFAYYDNYDPLSANGQAHLQDESNLLSDIQNGTLPSVAFDKPLGPDNEHPGYASLLQGQQHIASLVQAVQNSRYWNNTTIVITYDENGGRYDHVAPPTVDRWGVGVRVPGIEISPFAQRGYVDHTQYETDSILKTIEQNYNLKSLSKHDGQANPLYNAYTFSPSDLRRNNG